MKTMLKAKIHRARVTDANLDYEGSITIDARLLESSGIVPFEQVHVWNVTRGTRFETYSMLGERDTGEVVINGAAAHLAKKGDIVIIAAFDTLTNEEVAHHRPRLVYVDEKNRIVAEKSPAPKLSALS
ncbi:MAG: aspartate 1-decarboxylase [Nitrospirota bacterium]|nr:aspartate 1-decarboxylase [Nitrospirota bacterium]